MNLNAIFLSLLFALPLSTTAQTEPPPTGIKRIPIELSGKANIYFGEIIDTSRVRGGAGIPPVEIDVRGVKSITFEDADGIVSCIRDREGTYWGADGGEYGPKTEIWVCGAFSGILHDTRVMFVTGVMVSEYSRVEPPPEEQNFTGMENWAEYMSAFDRPFYIGDGKDDKGKTQTLYVPRDATTLILGFADCLAGPPSNYGDNDGTITITVVLNYDKDY